MSSQRCGDSTVEGALSALEDSGRGGGSLAGHPSLGTLSGPVPIVTSSLCSPWLPHSEIGAARPREV